MTEHLSEGTLNDLAEGLLSGEERDVAEEHLHTCAECRDRLDRLGRLVEALAALPEEAALATDLWPAIEGRLPTEARDADVVPLSPVRAPRRTGIGRRISLSVGQLLAAGIVLASISGGVAWLASSGSSTAGTGRGAAPTLPAPIRTAATRGAIADYEAATADLERVLEQGRGVLKPETIRVLEDNLRTIDRAIAEAEGALADDPGSEVLYRILAKNMKRKLDLLRSAALAISAAS